MRSNPGYRPGRMRWRQNLILRRLQGEPVEVPPDAEEIAVPVPDSSIQRDDSAAEADTEIVPPPVIDSIPPAPDTSP